MATSSRKPARSPAGPRPGGASPGPPPRPRVTPAHAEHAPHRQGDEDARAGDHPERVPPARQGQQQTNQGRDRRLPEIAGEVVGAEGPPRRRAVGPGDHRRGQGVLRAAAGAAEQEADSEPDEAARGAGDRVAGRTEQRAENQHRAGAEHPGEPARRHLQGRQGAIVEGPQEGQGDVVEAELRLPDRQQHVDQVRVAVVQGVVEARCRQRPPGLRQGGRSGRRGQIGRDGHPVILRGCPSGWRSGPELTNDLC